MRCFPPFRQQLLMFFSLLMGISHFSVFAQSFESNGFLTAYQAIQTKDFATLEAAMVGLEAHPLYHFLRYHQLKRQLKTVEPAEVTVFLQQFGNTGYGELLRRDWLDILANRRAWADYAQLYTPQKDLTLRCYHLQARLNVGLARQTALNEIKALWLENRGLPGGCQAIFTELYSSTLMTDDLLWQRIAHLMAKGEIKQANSLVTWLKNPDAKKWMSLWSAMHARPAQQLQKFKQPDSVLTQMIVWHGILRLAREKETFDTAVKYWEAYQKQYAFSAAQIGQMSYELATLSVKHGHPQMLRWLAAVDKSVVDDKLTELRVRTALRQFEWAAVKDFIQEIADTPQFDTQWQYWYARAVGELGDSAEARKRFIILAKERDYYGFLAAEYSQQPYALPHVPITFTPAESMTITQHPAYIRAMAFYQLRLMTQAKVEWNYLLTQLSQRQQAVAAVLAQQVQWYDVAVFTAAKADSWDDMNLRFPLVFLDELRAGAAAQNLDLGWVYGIVRQESVFATEARSSAGALGLMQLMPGTAQLLAKNLGISAATESDILAVDNNIAFGTAYLRQMLDKFDGNYMLATAAYNAGPGRAKRWAEENGCYPPDIWMELIPFTETRGYVRRVLFYTRVFEIRLNLPAKPLRLAAIKDANICQLEKQQLAEN